MRLPHTLSALQEALKKNEGVKLRSLVSSGKISTDSVSNPESKHILQYSVPSLWNGRPLDQVMIVLHGPTGTGKSTTINQLFEDNALCRVSATSSETAEVVQCIKELKVIRPEIKPMIQAKLNFVDVPGALDTDSRKEAENFRKIANFRLYNEALQKREIPSSLSAYRFAEKVYPNTVLLVFKSDDKRIEGQDSVFSKTVKLLKQQDLVDLKHPNLIVVGTHAAGLGLKKEKYIEKSSIVRNVVKKGVREHLGISDVPVIFVENEGEDFNLKRANGFYLLPDGSQSHANLIQEMQKMYNQTEFPDKLGLLLTSWYFREDCPDKAVKPVTKIAKDSAPASSDFEAEQSRTTELLRDLNIGTAGEVIPTLNFQSLGYAYCPVTESLRCHYLFEDREQNQMQTLKVANSKFLIPKYVKYFLENTTHFKCLSCYSKDEYEKSKSHQYNFEANVKLIVKVSSNGRWTQSANATNEETIISILFEKRVCSMQIDDPGKYLCPAFIQEMNSLPSTYDEDNAVEFEQFFSKYGTHLVSKQSLGGWIKFDCHVAKSSYSKENQSKIEVKVQAAIKALVAGGGYSTETAYQELHEAGVTDEQITIGGGDPPLVSSLKSITAEQLQSWLKTVEQHPSELEHTRTLYPFYSLDKCENKNTLREATLDYLKSTLKQRILKTRAEIADDGQEAATSSGPGCFPGDAMIITRKRGCKRMDELELYEEVLTLGGKDSVPKWTMFYGFAHKEVDTFANYVVLHFMNGKQLTITPNHLVFMRGKDGKRVEKFAGELCEGDALFTLPEVGSAENFPIIVKKTTTSIKGMYGPLTMTGTLLVNGFLATCYADIDNFKLAHMAFAPFRGWAAVAKRCPWEIRSLDDGKDGIHAYPKMLMKLRECLFKTK